MRRRRRQRGVAIVEFALAGVAMITIFISTFQLAMAMWNYHTLAYAVHEGTRYTAVHGVGCTKAGNTCSISVGTIASKIKSLGTGLRDDTVSITLTTDSGAATTCAPLNTCYSNTTTWPPSTNSDNRTGKMISITGRYHAPAILLFFWPKAGTQNFGALWLSANSQASIVF